MLDKVSERILKVAIEKCKGNPHNEVTLTEKDFLFPKIKLSVISSVCMFLYENGYFSTCTYYYEGDTEVTVTMKYKGFSYFDYKDISNKEFWKSLATSKISDIIVSVVAAIVTTLIISA